MANWVDGYYSNVGWLKIPKVTVDGSGNPTGLTYLGATIPLGGIALTDVWTAGGVRFDGTNFIDENSAVISGSPAVADQTALLALNAATYENFSVTVTSGLNRSTWTSNGTAFGPLNGQYLQERQTVPGNTYAVPDNVTWTAADNGSGKVRLESSAAHGITEANAEGNYLFLISGGTGWTALTSHQIAATTGYVDATHLDLTTNYTASMGVPVFAKATTTDALGEIVLKEITLPALRANSSVIIEYNLEWSVDAGGNQRRGKLFLDTTEFNNNNATTASLATTSYRHGFRNQNSASAQRGICGKTGNGYGTAASDAPITAAIATGTSGKILTIKAMSSVVGVTVALGGYDLIIRG